MTGYIYVLEISTGRIKVGFTTDLRTRLSTHRSTAKAYGAKILQTWKSALHQEAKANEGELIAFCKAYAGSKGDGEYYEGVPFEAITAHAEAHFTFTPARRGESAAEERKRAAREKRARQLDAYMAHVDATYAELEIILVAAGVDRTAALWAITLPNSQVKSVIDRLKSGIAVESQEIREVFARAVVRTNVDPNVIPINRGEA